jgi:hypothetical protein
MLSRQHDTVMIWCWRGSGEPDEIDMKVIVRMLFMALLALLMIPQAAPQGSTRAKFVVVMRGYGTSEDVGPWVITAWEGPPGMRLTESHVICTNADEAHKDFEKRIVKFKVVRREPKKDKDGRVWVSERKLYRTKKVNLRSSRPFSPMDCIT